MAIVPSKRKERSTSIFSLIKISVQTEEEILSKTLNRIGPPVAVGMPNEKLPEIGMARMYFDDSVWRYKVKELIKGAALVIMLMGDSKGFWEELEMVVENLDPRKLVLLLPFETSYTLTISPEPHDDEYTRIRKKAEKFIPKQLPAFAGKCVPGSNLSGIIWFDVEWNPRIYAFDQLKLPLNKTLQHVFKFY